MLVKVAYNRVNEVPNDYAGPLSPVSDAVTMADMIARIGVQLLPGQPGFVRRPPCQHLGKLTGEKGPCTACGETGEPVAIHACKYEVAGVKLHPLCTIDRPVTGTSCCQWCPHHEPKRKKVKESVSWAYGITTVPERKYTTLPRTLASLAAAGFVEPHLFVDGGDAALLRCFDSMTVRSRNVGAFGHWLLSLLELYIANPTATRFALFQDDLVCCANLRAYLDAQELPEDSYWNLYTVYENQELAGDRIGWFDSNQRGKGAVALVFGVAAVQALFRTESVVKKPRDIELGWRGIDGAVAQALCIDGPFKERCHNPSLVQHTGTETTVKKEGSPVQGTGGDMFHGESPSFMGESWDPNQLLENRSGRPPGGSAE